MVTLEHIPSIYVISYYNSLYNAWHNKCGGTNYNVATLVLAINNAIAALTATGGMIWLKELQNPGGISSYGTNILIVEEYHGTIKYYSNNRQIEQIGDDSFQTQTGAFANPTGSVFENRRVTVYNSTYDAVTSYTYMNGMWWPDDF